MNPTKSRLLFMGTFGLSRETATNSFLFRSVSDNQAAKPSRRKLSSFLDLTPGTVNRRAACAFTGVAIGVWTGEAGEATTGALTGETTGA